MVDGRSRSRVSGLALAVVVPWLPVSPSGRTAMTGSGFEPGTTALVTGATSGLGRHVALQLADCGVDVIITGRDIARGDKVVEEIGANGGRARFIQVNLDRPEEIRRLATEVGDIDVLINNAGGFAGGPTNQMTVVAFDGLFTTHARAPFLLVAAFAPGMAARARGSIVNVGSIAADLGMQYTAAYAGSKAALHALTRVWAAEYGPHGVRVNAVSPGTFRAPDKDPSFYEGTAAATLLGRVAEPAEIAAAIVFAASDRASYMTGTILTVDGGRTIT